MMTTLDGFPVPVAVSGPEKGVVVVILGDEQRAPAAYDAVCERLHTASIRTVVIGLDRRLTPKSVVGILDAVGITWAVVVGDRAGGELAWELAATKLGRFVGLVVIDRGHPRVAGPNDEVRDEHCPPVEIGTTVLVSSRPPGQWLVPASDSFTPSTASSTLDGAACRNRPRSWPPRSCCAPAPGNRLVD